MPWGAVIAAGASLIGGAQARKDERKGIREQNAYNHPSAIRARAEEAGFNPLLFIGPNTGTQTTAFQGGQMGQAITDAGMAFGSAIDQRSKQAKAIEQLEAQNEALRQRVTEAARPPIGGIYSQSMPALASLVGGAGVNAPMGSQSLEPSATGPSAPSPLFGDRPHQVMPSADGAGITRITNQFTGPDGIYVPGADGEPWGFDEVLTAAVVGGPQLIWRDMKSVPHGIAEIWRNWGQNDVVPMPENTPNQGDVRQSQFQYPPARWRDVVNLP